MSDMSIKMMLSLVDTATPMLTAFVNTLDSLGPKVTGLANRFNTLERNIAKIGSASEAASPKLDKLDSSVVKLESTSSSLERVLGTLPGVISTLTSAIQSATSLINQTAESFGRLTSASKDASGGVGKAEASLASMGGVVTGVTGKITSLHGVMEGLAAQWASMKIFEAGKSSVDEAAQYQQAQMKVSNLNLPAGQAAMVQNDATVLAKRLGLSVREGLEAYMSAIAGLATTDYADSKKVISATLDEAVKTAILLRLRGDTSSVNDLTRNLYGLVEARGQAYDPEAAKRTMELIQKFNTADAQKISTKDMETVSRQMKGGLGVSVSDEGFIRILALAEQLKAAGHGGGGGGMGVSQAGTAATQVAKLGTGGIQNKETIRMLEAMGLILPGAARGDSSTGTDNVRPGSLKYSEIAKEDPLKYMQMMAPYALALAMKNKDLFAKGKDLGSLEGVKAALSEVALAVFKNINVANIAAQMWFPGSSERINAKVEQTKQSKGIDESVKLADETYIRQVEKFDAAVKTFQTTLGTNLLPMLTEVIRGLTSFIGFLNSIAEAHPVAATLTEIALGIAAIGLALFGLQKMFGIFTMIGSLAKGLTGIAEASAIGAGGIKMLGGTLTGAELGFAGIIAKIGVKGALGLVGLLWSLYDVLLITFDAKVWGVSVGTWFSAFADSIINKLADMKDAASALIGVMSHQEAADKRAERANAEKRAREANGIGVDQNIAQHLKSGKITPVTTSAPLDGTVNHGVRTKEDATKETLALEELKKKAAEIDAKKLQGPPKKGYNSEAGKDKQEIRIEEEALKGDLKVLEAQRKAMELSDDDYFNKRMEAIITRYNRVIELLQSERKKLRPDQKQQADKIDADLEIARRNKLDALAVADAERDKATATYKAKMAEVQAILDESEGRKHEARLDKLAQKLAVLKQEATLAGDKVNLEKINKASSSVDMGIKFQDEYIKYENINNTVINQLELIDAKVKAGFMTEQEAAYAKYELRKKESEQLTEILDKLELLAEGTQDAALIQKIALLKTQMAGYASDLSPEAAKIKGVLENSFSSFFTDLTSRNKSLKQSFKDLFSSIASGITDLISKNLSQQLFKSLFGDAGSSSGGSSGGGFFDSIAGWFFGGSSSVASGTGAGVAQAGSLFGPPVEAAFDVGTNFVPYDMTARVHKGEIIVPAVERDNAISAMSGGGKPSVSVSNVFHVPAPTNTKTQMQIAANVSSSLQRASRNL